MIQTKHSRCRLMFLAMLLLAMSVTSSARGLDPSISPMVPMRDGVKLATDVYLPEGEGPFPILLRRTPYGKTRSAPASTADPYLRAGVALVAQDTRGRGRSEGKDPVFRSDTEDGHDTLAWLTKQSWCNGKVAMDGASALGIIQYMAAPGAPKVLCSICATVATPTLAEQGVYPGGVFRESLLRGWLLLQGSTHILKEIEEHPLATDPYWKGSRITDRFRDVNVPAAHIGGWYDIFSQGTLDAYVGFRTQGGDAFRDRQYLIMGPWTHGMESNFPIKGDKQAFRFPNPKPPFWVGPMAWTLHHLGVRDLGEPFRVMPRVQYYVMGDVDDPFAPGNEWRAAEDWPPPSKLLRLHLHADGQLRLEKPAVDGGTTEYRYDPEKPVPTVGGGNLLLPAGPRDQRELEGRPDVCVFETPPLTEPLEITGRVRARIHASSDTPDTDIVVRLCDVYPDGKSMLLLDGATRLSLKQKYEPGSVIPVDVDLWSTSVILNRGHRLRISVSSSNYPRFRANPNDGSLFGSGVPRVAKVRIHHSAQHPSWVELPGPTK